MSFGTGGERAILASSKLIYIDSTAKDFNKKQQQSDHHNRRNIPLFIGMEGEVEALSAKLNKVPPFEEVNLHQPILV